MTHDELLAKIIEDMYEIARKRRNSFATHRALRAVAELHKPEQLSEDEFACLGCKVGTSQFGYPCPTIQAIEKELK